MPFAKDRDNLLRLGPGHDMRLGTSRFNHRNRCRQPIFGERQVFRPDSQFHSGSVNQIDTVRHRHNLPRHLDLDLRPVALSDSAVQQVHRR